MAEQRIRHDDLVLSILYLVEGIVIKDERAEDFWIILLKYVEYGFEIGYLIKWDVDFAQGLATSERVQVWDCTLRGWKSLQERAVPQVKLVQIGILVQVQHFELRETEVSWEAPHLIDV